MTKLEKWIVGIIVSCMVFIIGSFAYVSNIVEEQRGAKQVLIDLSKEAKEIEAAINED